MHGGISIRVYFLLDCLFILQDKSRTIQLTRLSVSSLIHLPAIPQFSSLSLRKSNQIHRMPRLSASQNKLVSTRKNKASAVCLKSSNIGLICRQSALLDCYSIRDKVFYRSNKFFFFSLMATFRMIRSMWHWKDSD